MAWRAIRTAVQSFDEVRHALAQLAQRPTVTTVTSTYAATGGEDVILINNASAAVAVTVPDAAACEGASYCIKVLEDPTDDPPTTYAASVTTGGGNIDGNATYTFAAQHEAITVMSDGTNWWIVSKVA